MVYKTIKLGSHIKAPHPDRLVVIQWDLLLRCQVPSSGALQMTACLRNSFTEHTVSA